jgi:cytochrome c-type biogenesis protein CcsB
LVDGEIDGKPLRKKLQKDMLLAAATQNDFVWVSDFNGQEFTIQYQDFIENAEEGLVEDLMGEDFLKIVEAGDGNRHEHYLKSGEVSNIHNILFALNKPTPGAINIRFDGENYFIQSPFYGSYMRMIDQNQGQVIQEKEQPLQLRSLYNLAGMQFVIPDPIIRGRYGIVPAKEPNQATQDALEISLSSMGETQNVTVLGGKGTVNSPKQISLAGLDFWISYGSIELTLPFSIRLNDFIAERYPGTEKSYSSFKSKITVEDTENFDYEIYMNHVLDYRGYRFFQASFDPDEKGTVLSVNHDFWGTWVTYIGYFLLYIGLMGILFFGKTRFRSLAQQLENIRKKKAALTLVFLLFSSLGIAQTHQHQNRSFQTIDSVLISQAIPKAEAEKFGSLVIQDLGGRMKPVNTFASELLRKVSKSDTYKGLSADQVLLSIVQNPLVWYQTPMIYLKRGNDSLRSALGIDAKAKYASFVDFFDGKGNYKLASQLEQSYKAAVPNQFQKDFIDVDRKVNLLYAALEGNMLRIFPIPNDPNNKWISFTDLSSANFQGTDSLYVKNVLPLYFNSLRSQEYSQADQLLESLKGFQKKYGSQVIPIPQKIEAEILYNKFDIFKSLFSWYMYAGALMFVMLIVQIFNDKRWIRVAVGLMKYVIVGLFLAQTAGLIARWYISGHAPWSDAYESMIYVAWATVAMGLAFGRKSDLTIASTAFVSSMILMIAHWNWMDPEIANLQPVLDSYWLMIHVAVIVGSYGPFTLGMILGVVSLLLILLTRSSNKEKMKLHLSELTVVNELALTVGLIMLTIGNFLGGMWANESWGRYWGWDPKETWALISIMIYAFVVHMRLIPGLRSKWLFNLASIVAFASIVMTYFGVNFYLSGLHSYASGDRVITPNFVYYSIAIVFVLGLFSYFRHKKHFRE